MVGTKGVWHTMIFESEAEHDSAAAALSAIVPETGGPAYEFEMSQPGGVDYLRALQALTETASVHEQSGDSIVVSARDSQGDALAKARLTRSPLDGWSVTSVSYRVGE